MRWIGVIVPLVLALTGCVTTTHFTPGAVETDDSRTGAILDQIGDRLRDWEKDALRDVLRIHRPGRVMTIDSHNHLSFTILDRFTADGMVKMVEYEIKPEDPSRESEISVTRTLVYASAHPEAGHAFERLRAVAGVYAEDLRPGGGSGFESHIIPDNAKFIDVRVPYEVPSIDDVAGSHPLFDDFEGYEAEAICFGVLLDAFDRIMLSEATR